MYGMRYPVHTRGGSFRLNYWDRVAMEAELIRYQNNFALSAMKVGQPSSP
jgi:hypothetical protein